MRKWLRLLLVCVLLIAVQQVAYAMDAREFDVEGVRRTIPPPPVLTAPANGDTLFFSDVYVAVELMNDVRIYEFQIATTVDFLVPVANISTDQPNSQVNLPNNTYYVRARASNGPTLTGDWSSIHIFTVAAGYDVDVTIVSSPEFVSVGQIVQFDIQVANTGLYPITNITLDAYYANMGSASSEIVSCRTITEVSDQGFPLMPVTHCMRHIGYLDVAHTTVITLYASVLDWRSLSLPVEFVVAAAEPEYYLENNITNASVGVYEVPLCNRVDFDNDGFISLSDYNTMVGGYYACSVNYDVHACNWRYDLNRDGAVTISEVQQLAWLYNRPCNHLSLIPPSASAEIVTVFGPVDARINLAPVTDVSIIPLHVNCPATSCEAFYLVIAFDPQVVELSFAWPYLSNTFPFITDNPALVVYSDVDMQAGIAEIGWIKLNTTGNLTSGADALLNLGVRPIAVGTSSIEFLWLEVSDMSGQVVPTRSMPGSITVQDRRPGDDRVGLPFIR